MLKQVVLIGLLLGAIPRVYSNPPFSPPVSSIRLSYENGVTLNIRARDGEVTSIELEIGGQVISAPPNLVNALHDPMIEKVQLFMDGEVGSPSSSMHIVIPRFDSSITKNGQLGPYYRIEVVQSEFAAVFEERRRVNWLD